jgi:hypothetical protein
MTERREWPLATLREALGLHTQTDATNRRYVGTRVRAAISACS